MQHTAEWSGLPTLYISMCDSKCPGNPQEKKHLIENYKQRAQEHNAQVLNSKTPDAGFDLICPNSEAFMIPNKALSFKVPMGVKCYMTGHKETDFKSYYMYPRSSTGSKSGLRLSNSVGIIDSGYRGEIIAVFDNHLDSNELISPERRLVQICSGDLSPFLVNVCKNDLPSSTSRGAGGFGSTGA
tara:strand:- start:304 stop:858 length:555 start_codon:yes stop_codon:yes gene_type:complete